MKSSRPGPLTKSGLFRSSSFFAVDEADLALAEDAAAVHDGAAIVDLQAALPPRDALMVPLSNIAVQRRPEDSYSTLGVRYTATQLKSCDLLQKLACQCQQQIILFH